MIEKRVDKYYIEDALVLTNQTTVGAMNMREYRIKNPDKSKSKCKKKCKPNSKVYIDNKTNKHNLEIITNKKEIEINKKEYQGIIDYLNYKTNSNFILIDEYKKLIANILKKYTINDIKTVIDKKTSEWINNPKMKPYLTPETLFGPKFERYLHQQAKTKTIQDISLEEIRRAKEMRDKQNG